MQYYVVRCAESIGEVEKAKEWFFYFRYPKFDFGVFGSEFAPPLVTIKGYRTLNKPGLMQELVEADSLLARHFGGRLENQ